MTGRFDNRAFRATALPSIAQLGLSLLPLTLIQLFLGSAVRRVAASQSALLKRLGRNATKRFLIDPTDAPFAFVLVPDPQRPFLRAVRRAEPVDHDVRITGTFFDLLAVLDGMADGDALFFNRCIDVSGDIEAIVALRNALEDYDGRLIEDAVSALGPFSGMATRLLSAAITRGGTRE